MKEKFCPGFTLIELLISISLVALISGLGLASFTEFNRRQVVASTAKQLVSDLRLAQNKAESGDKACTGTLLGYKLIFNVGNVGYTVQAACVGQSVVVKSVTFPAGISKISGFTEVFFRTLRQGVILTPEDQTSVTIQLANTTLQKTVTVTHGGEIYINE